MNKTLLLILCDFLLLNLLALTRWEKAEPPRPRQPPVPELAANAVTKEQDLVETMRQSLADQQAARDELAQKLSAADAALAAREQSLTQLNAERTRLAQEKEATTMALTSTQKAAAELQAKVASATQEASITKEQLAQLQRELAEKEAEAKRQQQALAELKKAHDDARKQIEGLTMAVVVAEQEKKNLRETADALKSQVQVERAERIKVQEATTQLAQGVGQLAASSGELTKEIRENRAVNANVLFGDFQANRVAATIAVARHGFFGETAREKVAATVLVKAGGRVYALLHLSGTPFSLNENGDDWERLQIGLAHDGGRAAHAAELVFLQQDPRLIAIPLDPTAEATIGTKAYVPASDPFKFPEAVLIDANGQGYGEVGFKVDPTHAGFVRVDNRLFKRLFGDFAPKRGDLVFSKTGDFLGVMVNNDYCAVVREFAAFRTLRAGSDIGAQKTGAILDAVVARVKAMPPEMQ